MCAELVEAPSTSSGRRFDRRHSELVEALGAHLLTEVSAGSQFSAKDHYQLDTASQLAILS
jgi:hypothetical protein